MRRVAIIDVGSNSTKLLVAEGLNVVPVHEAFLELRLLNKENGSRISEESFAAGLLGIKQLLDIAKNFSPEAFICVGTSVFRSAENALDFSNAVQKSYGIPFRILSGEEEAEGIACGVGTEPLIYGKSLDFSIFDLGGGSLEFIESGGSYFKSWPLGAVRLMHKFIANPDEAIPQEELKNIRSYVREIAGTELVARASSNNLAVVCGGALAVAHAIFSAQDGISPNLFSRELSVERLNGLLERLAAQARRERIKTPGLPESRADLFPAALAIILELAEICGFEQFLYSSRNLRYGIAYKFLSALS